MPDSPRFSVIIPVFNKWELTKNCLTSLKRHPDVPFEVVVVDNASTDATQTELDSLGQTLFGDLFRSFHLPTNINFGPASNLGAEKAKTSLLFFLNNDTEIREAFALPLLEALEEPSVAAVGPLLLYPDDTVQHVGIAFTFHQPVHLYRHFPHTHPVILKKRQVRALTAAALFIPRRLFLEEGGFYPGFINGFEDVDLCLRLGQRGQKFYCVPNSRIYHLESQSQGRENETCANAALLQERLHGYLPPPDLHLHGLKDGFEPIISDMYELTLGMRALDEEKLIHCLQGASVQEWFQCLRANPLFRLGREILAARCEERGEIQAALMLRREIVFCFRMRQDCLHLLALEGKTENENAGIFREAHKVLKAIETEGVRMRNLIRKRVHTLKDPVLIRLFEAKRLKAILTSSSRLPCGDSSCNST